MRAEHLGPDPRQFDLADGSGAWLSSSFSGPRGSLSRLRPSAIEPEDTTRTSRPSRCSLAMSSASAASHDARTSPSVGIDQQRGADLDDDAAELIEFGAGHVCMCWRV